MSVRVERNPRVRAAADEIPGRVVFAAVSGAHLYGFASPDSDVDLRGAHLISAEQMLGLKAVEDTFEVSRREPGLELDLVSHDLRKFARMMLKRNGYVLEQLLSPLVVRTSPVHEELVALAPGCVTRHHAHHYAGFAANEWKLFAESRPRRVKPLLYVYRILLTGIRLMRTGEVEANLVRLNEEARLSFLWDLLERKRAGGERAELTDADVAFHDAQRARLVEELRRCADETVLPENPSVERELDALVVRSRLHWRP